METHGGGERRGDRRGERKGVRGVQVPLRVVPCSCEGFFHEEGERGD